MKLTNFAETAPPRRWLEQERKKERGEPPADLLLFPGELAAGVGEDDVEEAPLGVGAEDALRQFAQKLLHHRRDGVDAKVGDVHQPTRLPMEPTKTNDSQELGSGNRWQTKQMKEGKTTSKKWMSFFMLAWWPGARNTSCLCGPSLLSFRINTSKGPGMSGLQIWSNGTPNLTLKQHKEKKTGRSRSR